MNARSWTFLLLAAALLALAVFVLKQRPDHPVNRSFALFTLGLAGWVLGLGGLYGGGRADTWGRFTFASASIVPAAFLSFAWAYPAPDRWPRPAVRRVVWSLGLGLTLLSLTTRLVVREGRGLTPAGLSRESGPVYPLFAAYFLVVALTGLTVFIAKWRRARGLERVQLQYLGIGLVIATAGGVTANLLVPLITGQSTYSELGPYFLLPLVLLVGHAIIRHRLLDIRMIIHRSVAFAVVIAAVSGAAWAVLLLVLPAPADRVLVPMAGLVLAAVALLCFSAPVAPRLGRLIDAYLFRGRPDLDRALREAARGLSRVRTTEEVTAEMRRVLQSTLMPETLTILTEPPDENLSSGDARRSPSDADPVAAAAWAAEAPVPAVRLLGGPRPASGCATDADGTLRAAGIEVWVGLGRAGKRSGVVLLGPRKDGQAYLEPALRFLEDTAEMASMAIETATWHRRQVALDRERERLAHLARMGRACAGLGHEIRTPLTTISALIELLPDRLDDVEYRKLICRVVPSEVSRIVKLSEQLRALAPDTRRLVRSIELAEVLGDVVSMLSPVAEKQGTSVVLEVAPNLPAVAGDVDQLVSLFQNLVRNAIDAMPAGGRIVVRATEEGSQALVQVIDGGRGLDPAVRDSLFEPFVTTKPTGLGLGLSICRELAHAHGARLTLTDREDGPGAVAEIVFPPATEHLAAPAPVPDHPDRRQPGG